jgi:His-Xaa-Ser system protein HxsD
MVIKNINIDENEKICSVKVSTKVYDVDVIYSAAYVLIDKAYVLLDGDPKKEIIVILKPKKEYNLEKIGLEFCNELVNYAEYKKQGEKTKKIRESIIQRSLITNDPSLLDEDSLFNDEEDLEKYLDDPEGIAIPWEEKNTKKKK